MDKKSCTKVQWSTAPRCTASLYCTVLLARCVLLPQRCWLQRTPHWEIDSDSGEGWLSPASEHVHPKLLFTILQLLKLQFITIETVIKEVDLKIQQMLTEYCCMTSVKPWIVALPISISHYSPINHLHHTLARSFSFTILNLSCFSYLSLIMCKCKRTMVEHRANK